MENLFWSELKHLFTYSPIHLFHSLEIKWKNGKLVLVGVKTPIHLFTYSPFLAPRRPEIKSKNGKLVLVGVKTPIHLFTYSPIHPSHLSLPTTYPPFCPLFLVKCEDNEINATSYNNENVLCTLGVGEQIKQTALQYNQYNDWSSFIQTAQQHAWWRPSIRVLRTCRKSAANFFLHIGIRTLPQQKNGGRGREGFVASLYLLLIAFVFQPNLGKYTPYIFQPPINSNHSKLNHLYCLNNN
jgi:hypothetical protein